ncbi:S-adenosylmethionine:tRNA ribosyltransferase-isomerase [Dictyobacter formicarum]|uniref:Queuosine biosynthesis protein n=1 Tax=Dictyobacter formicarum TaxID=2778368 RepID=A0ABQ3VAI7_9CHLR|nr:S-adenosylmethionine:tRNA ribosyltransferase-isomerase [Dictyobacter formicarum]GHO82800.1 queuosine biosynthesis protein [Dictyobacter formicarum]
MMYVNADPFYSDDSPVAAIQAMDFILPPELEATMPPEARGLTRDAVRLMVSYRSNDHIVHTRFQHIGDFLQAGDVVIINTSATMRAALQARRVDGTPLVVHLSTRLPADLWVVEIRQYEGKTTRPFFHIKPGETLYLQNDATITLHTPHDQHYRNSDSNSQQSPRLWIATLKLPATTTLEDYLNNYGSPIRYSYVRDEWPIAYYQTTYANEVGSSEMPSAGRAFTPTLLTSLIARGIQIVPLLLHTGVASLESHELPYEEFYRVPATTAGLINVARHEGRRLIAVGTTVVRALETVTTADGITHPGEGWTRTIVTPERGIRSINALLTGFHEPQATHLAMLETLANRHHLQLTYQAALQQGYLWHEFGDLHLILP